VVRFSFVDFCLLVAEEAERPKGEVHDRTDDHKRDNPISQRVKNGEA
jgi:hypothetical protein